MRISVLMNNFNYARFLEQAIDSALDEADPDVEIIVVDDRSTDESPGILQAYGDRITTVLLDENGGQAHSVNAGLPHCTGDWVAMLDTDDYFLPGKFEMIRKVANTHPNAVLICDPCQQINAQGRLWGQPIPPFIPTGDIRDAAVKKGGFWSCPPMSGLTFRRDFLARVLPQPAYLHRVSFDHWLANVACLTGPVAASSDPFTIRRLHGRNKYKHGERMQRQLWTLLDDQRRLERMIHLINRERLGEPRRLNPENKLWYSTMRYWSGELSTTGFLRRYLRHGPEPTLRGTIRHIRHILREGRRLRPQHKKMLAQTRSPNR